LIVGGGQVYLRNSATGDKLVYAVSWWSEAEFKHYMAEASAPIWVNLQKQHAELYRAIERVYLGGNAELEDAFAAEVRDALHLDRESVELRCDLGARQAFIAHLKPALAEPRPAPPCSHPAEGVCERAADPSISRSNRAGRVAKRPTHAPH
jgi:hypothetical protein